MVGWNGQEGTKYIFNTKLGTGNLQAAQVTAEKSNRRFIE